MKFRRNCAVAAAMGLGVGLALMGPVGPAAAATVSVELYATAGTTTLPGGESVPVWGYTLAPGGTVSHPGGPVIEANAGDTVSVTLHNDLTVDTGLLFQGQQMSPDLSGVAAAGSTTYTFTAGQAGTYLYEAALLPGAQYQTAMGLHGALVVHPSTAGQAYDDASTAYDDEAALVMSEIDPALNSSANPAGFDMRKFNPRYSLLNGKAYPDTDAIATSGGSKVLLRYVNAGVLYHSMGVLGASQRVIALDGSPLADARTYTAETVGPGQTADALVTAPDVGATHNLSVFDASLLLHNSNKSGLGGMYTSIAITGTAVVGDTVGPVSSAATVSPANLLEATVSDADRGNSNVTAAEYFIDTVGAVGTGTAMGGTFGSPTLTANAVLPNLDPVQEHVVYVRGFDGTNWGPFSSVLMTGPDSGGPTTLSPSLTPNQTNHDPSKAGVVISATGDDSASGKSNIAAAEYRIDGGIAVPMTVAPPNSVTIASLDATIPQSEINLLTEGTHTVSIRSQDADGNWGLEVLVPLDIDLTAPATSGVQVAKSPNNGTVPFNSSIPAVRVSVQTMVDTGVVQGTVKRAEMFIDTVGVDGTGIPLVASDGLFNGLEEGGYGDIPLSTVQQMTNGNHTIYVHARDAAGNWGANASAVLLVDKAAPTLSAASVSPSPTNGASPVTFSGTVTDNLTAPVAAEWFTGTDPGAGNGTALTAVNVSGGGPYSLSGSIDVSDLGEGTYTLRVRVKDAAGNWSAASSVSLVVTGPVYYSTLGATSPPGVGGTADDADIYNWSGAAHSRVWDATTQGVPTNANVDGLDRVDNTHFYVSFAADTNISGFGGVQDEDILYNNNGVWSVYFDGTALGLTGANLDIDGFNISGGDLYFSTRGNTNPPGVTGAADDADIYRWNGTSFSRVVDATAIGLPAAANVDGLVWQDGTHQYLSFAADAAVPGQGTVQDEDVVHRGGNVWAVYFNGTGHGLTNNNHDIDAFDVP